ncbi:MAG: alpha/beta hydrolase [bacterium]
MKRVVIVHGLNGSPGEGWFPWIKKKLEDRGFSVTSSQFPLGENLTVSKWQEQLKKDCVTLDRNLFFIGHSLGCISIIRFIENLPKGVIVGGAVFVAPFIKKLKIPEISEFTNTSLNVEKAKSHILKSVCIISEEDPSVPFDIAMDFVNRTNSEFVIDNGKGHFGKKSGIKELPSALEAILKISK